MKTIVLIPARLDSTRFPNKPLVPVNTPEGKKPLLQCVYEQAQKAQHRFAEFDEDGMELYVVTSDDKIAEAVNDWGGRYIWLPDNAASVIRNGTERCYYALKSLGLQSNPKLRVVNLQGDEYIHPDMLLELVRLWPQHKIGTVVTPHTFISNVTHENDVKAVLARNGKVLWFSRNNIPHSRNLTERISGFLHIGLYMYNTKALKAYMGWQPTIGESTESLEQLRFLECGETMWSAIVNLPSISVNVPRDIEYLQLHIEKGN